MIRSLALVGALAWLAACPKGGDKPKTTEPPASRGDAPPHSHLLPDEDGGIALPPATPLPSPPASLPPPPENTRVTPEAVALGELLFFDARLSSDGTVACATCHDAARGYAGGVDKTASGKQNLRRTPALVNLAWATSLGWDGRATGVREQLSAHLAGQLGTLDASLPRLVEVPTYRAHLARVGGAPSDAVVQALEAFVLTRYEGDAPWDAMERTARAVPGTAPSDPIAAGYQLFTGKAQCAVCHPPPLYTDHGFHRVERDTLGDKGRGLVDDSLIGAFKTPTLRGAARRGAYFHTGSKRSLDEVVAYYQAVGAAPPDPALDAALTRIRLSSEEAKQLVRFLEALTGTRPPPAKPVLP